MTKRLTDEQKAVMKDDMGMTTDQLKAKYGGEEGEHPVATRADFETDRKLFFGQPEY